MIKIKNSIYNNSKMLGMFALLFMLSFSVAAQGEVIENDEQEEVEEDDAPEKIRYKDQRNVRNSFNSTYIMDQQTPLVPIKGTIQMDMHHRFGTFLNGWEDLAGIYGAANIRIGVGYVPVKGLMLGWGVTKERMQMDFNAKYAIYEQKMDGFPMSVTYHGNMSLETRKKKFYNHGSDRLSYFNQLIFASKVHDVFSIIVAPSLSWFNTVDGFVNDDDEVIRNRSNTHFAISTYGRIRINSKLAVTLGYDQPLTKHRKDNPNPNLSIGLEMSTSSHSFQVIVGNYNGIIPQASHFYNSNDYRDGAFLLGFNITRLWNR
jgi:hypothetical protein